MKKWMLSTLIAIFTAVQYSLIAQSPASSNSIYSDQKYAPYENPAWWETPSVWIGLALLIIVVIVLIIGRRKRKYT